MQLGRRRNIDKYAKKLSQEDSRNWRSVLLTNAKESKSAARLEIMSTYNGKFLNILTETEHLQALESSLMVR